MPTAVRVHDPKSDIHYGFMYKIETFAELMEYWDAVARPRWSRGLAEIATGRHATTSQGVYIENISSMREESPLITAQKAMEDNFLSMEKSLKEGPIVVNRNGGFFNLSPRQAIQEVITLEKWVLPGAKIVVTKWPGGTHYYARVGDQEVEVNGQRKWFSEHVAMINAKRYAKAHNIVLEGEEEK